MADQPYQSGKITVQELRGLNERKQFANPDLGEFDILYNALPTTANALTKPNGIKLLQQFDSPVLNICQTNDTRGNIIVQLKDRVIVLTETELFNRPDYNPDLNFYPDSSDEENMPFAIIVHNTGGGVGGGTLTTGTTNVATFNSIPVQVNADGTPADFLTRPVGSTTQFTVAAGVYRIEGWHYVANSLNAGTYGYLYDVTNGVPLFYMGTNEMSNKVTHKVADQNYKLEVIGAFTAFAPMTIEFRIITTATKTVTGMGAPTAVGGISGVQETYGMLKIIKTS